MVKIGLPASMVAGDTLRFSAQVSDYPATDGWELNIALLSPVYRYTMTATADGADYRFSIDPATSQNWKPATYRYAAFVQKAGERHTVANGFFDVTPDFVTHSSNDIRHHVEKVLDALESALEKKASRDQLEMAFNGRQIKYIPPSELLAWRDSYRKQLAAIRKSEAIKQGETQTGIIKARFG
ncbi:MAG: hypothetical protein CSB48_02930 [Proteobacteria bacterium]|nr:MAG: hypothetical protein CSB48_02930 [Pseudomonadota bacterium]